MDLGGERREEKGGEGREEREGRRGKGRGAFWTRRERFEGMRS